MRERDLTEVINNRNKPSYLGRALCMHWNVWGRYELDNAERSNPRLRRLATRQCAGHFGVRIPD